MNEDFSVEDVTRLRIAMARIARVLAKQSPSDELTQTQLSVLGTVVRDGPIGLGELAEFEGINPTMLSRVVGKLDDRGLIRRIADPNDRRAALVEASEEGKRLQLQSRARRTQLLVQRLAGLPDDQRDELRAALPALETLADHLGPKTAGAATRSRKRV
jgi:DNA-binding MarR family transcriptional regulator